MEMVLYRAAEDETWSDCAAFASTIEAARAYLDNPGFGGRRLFRAVAQIDTGRVLDLYDSVDPVQEIADRLDMGHPGAIGADEWVPRLAYELRGSGLDWVRVRESYPVDTETWIFVGDLDAEPEMEEIP